MNICILTWNANLCLHTLQLSACKTSTIIEWTPLKWHWMLNGGIIYIPDMEKPTVHQQYHVITAVLVNQRFKYGLQNDDIIRVTVKLCQHGVKNATTGNSYGPWRGQKGPRLNQKPSQHAWDVKRSHSPHWGSGAQVWSKMSKNSCCIKCKQTFRADAVSAEGNMGHYVQF